MVRRMLLLAMVTAIALATGCGGESPGPGVASVSPTASAKAKSKGAEKASAVAYSRCMRDHGLESFPDPGPDGEVRLHATPGSELDPDSPRFQAAEKACKPLLPNKGRPAKDPAEVRAATLKYSKCMRANGIKDFPDPNADGGLEIKATPGSNLDPDSPRFKAADKACKHHLPDGGKGGSTSSKEKP